jgi:hypothetical protein
MAMTDQQLDSSLLKLPARIDPGVIPPWLTEHYQGMESEIEEWFTSFYFWRRWNGDEANLAEVMVLARANATAKMEALQQTSILKGASDKSIYLQLYHAQKTGWFRLVEEIESVQELLERMLADEIERDPDGGTRYELEFIIKTMIPTMEHLGVPKEQIISIPQNLSKAKAAVPVIRQLVQTGSPETEAQIMEVFKEIADPDIKVRAFKSNNAERMGRAKPGTPVVVPGAIYLIPGSEMIVIDSDRAHTNAIQIALRGIVEDLSIKDGRGLLNILSQRLLPKTNNFDQLVLRFQDDHPILMKSQGNGFPMPSETDMMISAFNEAARVKFYVDQLLPIHKFTMVPVFTLSGSSNPMELVSWVQDRFEFQVQDPSDAIPCLMKALNQIYKTVHPDMSGLFSNCNFWMESFCKRDWGLFIGLVIASNDYLNGGDTPQV